jgi:PilZ domain
MDRRRHERSDVEAPVNFSWKVPESAGRRRGEGTIRNISRGGVFVSTGDHPAVGARVRFHIFFRSFFPGSRLVMQTNAVVVRTEPSSQAEVRTGFAAALESYTLRNEEEIIERVKH